jgi:hypothetical protein
MPTFCTDIFDPDLKGYVDIWSHPAGGWIWLDFAADEVAQGRAWGFYNGSRPYSGSTGTTAAAVDFRVIPWIVTKYHADHYFYWETTYWESSGGIFVNGVIPPGAPGDGVFFYPGQESTHPDQDRGLQGPLSSIRMKNWRRGVQDMEYIWLLNKVGNTATTTQILNSCVPQALDNTNDITSWPDHGYGFDRYRKQMAQRLETATNTAFPVTKLTAKNVAVRLMFFGLDGKRCYRSERMGNSSGIYIVNEHGRMQKSIQMIFIK